MQKYDAYEPYVHFVICASYCDASVPAMQVGCSTTKFYSAVGYMCVGGKEVGIFLWEKLFQLKYLQNIDLF